MASRGRDNVSDTSSKRRRMSAKTRSEVSGRPSATARPSVTPTPILAPACAIVERDPCFGCLKQEPTPVSYHNKPFSRACKRGVDSYHRALKLEGGNEAVKGNIQEMLTSPDTWRLKFAGYAPDATREMRKDARQLATAEGRSYMDANSYHDVSKLSQDLIMSKETYRIWGNQWLPGWTDTQKVDHFDKMRAEQGSGEDTDGENIAIKNPVKYKEKRTGKRVAKGLRQAADVTQELCSNIIWGYNGYQTQKWCSCFLVYKTCHVIGALESWKTNFVNVEVCPAF